MWRYVAHPGEIEIVVTAGRVILSGSVLSHEHDDLVQHLSEVPGVEDVVDELSIYETAEDISELGGGRAQRHDTPGALPTGPQLLAGAAGTTLALYALRHPGTLIVGLIGAAAAAAILNRASKPPRRVKENIVDVPMTLKIDTSTERAAETPRPDPGQVEIRSVVSA